MRNLTYTIRRTAASALGGLRGKRSCAHLVAAMIGLFGIAAPAWSQDALASSRFDADTEGWIGQDFTGLCATLFPQSHTGGSHIATGGLPGGYFTYREPSNTGIDPFLRAPSVFHGDLADAYGGFLKFDRRMIQNAGGFSIQDVHFQGVVAGEIVTLIGDSRGRPQKWWRANWMPLVEGVWRVGSCEGPYATESEIRDVLANLTEVLIKAEYRSGVEDHHIDNVIILGPAVGPVSTFEFDIDGWSIAGDATISWYDSPGDAPQCIQAIDAANGVGYDFVAPVKFRGDQSNAVGLTMELDFWASPGGSTFPDGGAPGFVRVFGSNGEVLRYHNANLPITGSKWRHHSIPLRPSPAWTRGSDQGLATNDDFVQVFGSITKLVVRGEYRSGTETERMDNVVFGSTTPSVIASVEGAFGGSACINDPTRIESFAGGEGPFVYQWVVESPENSGVYVALADGAFFDGSSGLEFDAAGSVEKVLEVSNYMRGARLENVRFAVIVSTPTGSVRSNRIKIELDCCPADLTGDFTVDTQDFVAFLNAWASGHTLADWDENGIIDTRDFIAYLNAWTAGCP